jgi:hypothetical protein
MQAYLAAKYVPAPSHRSAGTASSFACVLPSYMSGAKADAILARSGDKKKKRKRKMDNDDYSGNAHASGSGLRLAEEGDSGWGHEEDKKDEDDAPGELDQVPPLSTA